MIPRIPFHSIQLLATPTLKISPCGRNDSIIITLRKTLNSYQPLLIDHKQIDYE